MNVKCLDCNIIFIADTTHHHLDMCPKCGKNGVDYETYMTRLIGNIKIIKHPILGKNGESNEKNKKEPNRYRVLA